MGWLKPKTDWKETDYFNASDYNRIVGDVLYLEELSEQTIGGLTFDTMTASKSTLDMIYSDEINAIQKNVKKMNKYNLYENFRTYEDNGTFMTYEELNKLEALIHMLYITMKSQIQFIPHMPLTLGRKFFIPKEITLEYEEEMYRLSYILQDEKGDFKQ